MISKDVDLEITIESTETKSRTLPIRWSVKHVPTPGINPLEGWTVEEDIIDDTDEIGIGCDEDGNIHPELMASLKVWERAYHHNNYENAKKVVTDDTN